MTQLPGAGGRNTLERRCLGKDYKRLFMGSTKSIFKMLEKIKKI